MTEPPFDSMIEMTRDLVRIPSRAGADPYDPIVSGITRWLNDLGVPHQVRRNSSGSPIAVVSVIDYGQPGPTYVLDATFDTSPYGDESRWEVPPTSGEVIDGWLYGRGAADCKAGIAIFSHIGAALRSNSQEFAGKLFLLFDGDEHSSTFRGAQAFFEDLEPKASVDGVMIGYPGNDRIVIGSRGFLRAELIVRGTATHSGSGSESGDNAVVKAAKVVEEFTSHSLPEIFDMGFDRPPKMTVTWISGGEGFSTVPDLCRVGIDIRLTPSFDAKAATTWLLEAVASTADRGSAETPDVRIIDSKPAYMLSRHERFVRAIAEAGESVFGRPIPLGVVGPSNIGNYLAELGIPATAGFGVTYEHLHAANERFEVASLGLAYQTYLLAIESLMYPASWAP